jgi:hypothetical protein
MGPSVGLIAMQADDEQLDDWLGTISDDDWDEGAIARAGLRRAMPADQEPADAEDDARRDAASDRAAADDHHAKVVWRRRVAALASLAVLVLAVVVGVLLLRGGDERPVPPVDGTGDTTSTPTETVEAPTTTTPSTTTPTTTTPSTTPDSAAFSLPEGTKLQSEDAEPSAASDLEVSTDPELVTALQQALVSAGYDPGEPDGTFGPKTEAAVVAFQQDNGLTSDGIVGPETASALNAAIADG